MSIIKDIISHKTPSVLHPCSNCPENCSVSPSACSDCKPYKDALLKALYDVDNMQEYYSRYQVGEDQPVYSDGMDKCPNCNSPVKPDTVCCEYCGLKIRKADENTIVKIVSDIPSPILTAQDIIFERHEKLMKNHSSSANSLGNKMTAVQIQEMAEKYGVPISSYLKGLDNGLYLTMDSYKDRLETEKSDTIPDAGISSLHMKPPVKPGSIISAALGSINPKPHNQSDSVSNQSKPSAADILLHGFSGSGGIHVGTGRPSYPISKKGKTKQ